MATYYISSYTGAQMDTADNRSLNPDATPTSGSSNLVESGGLYAAIEDVAENSAPAIVEAATGALASFSDAAASPIKSLVAEIVAAQAGSGTPSPDNVRAITGFTGVNAVRAGKNILKNNATSGTNNGVTYTVNSDGTMTLNGTASANSTRNINFVAPAPKGVPLTASIGTTATSGVTLRVGYIKADGSSVSTYASTTNSTPKVSFTFPDEAVLMRVFVQVNSGVSVSGLTVYPQIELGSTATAYEPYAGDTYAVSWQDEAGTVYGGTVDIVSGLLTVTHAGVDLGTLTWTANTTAGTEYRMLTNGLTSLIKPPASNADVPKIMCEIYEARSGNQTFARNEGLSVNISGQINVYDTRYNTSSSAAAFKTAMNGVLLVYELATPQTYQLTPTEVLALAGITNIWADTGDVTVQYRADTALFIAEKVPDAPTTDGTYTLTATVTSGVAVYSWT